MRNNVGPVRHSGKVIRREFASQFVEAEYETRLACIRCTVSIAVVLVWRMSAA
jgi:hypothetical protein